MEDKKGKRGHIGFNRIVKHKVMGYYIRLHINTHT